MKKALILFCTLMIISGCGNTPKNLNANQPEPTPTRLEGVEITPIPEADTRIEIPADTHSRSHGLTEVASADCRLISKDSFETVTLYTSASKENGRFVWDDHAKWLLEITSDTGAVYTLYDTEVSNGSIYFDIVEIDNSKYILLRNISTAADYTKAFTFENEKLYETNELDLNGLKDKAVNLIFTSVPKYR